MAQAEFKFTEQWETEGGAVAPIAGPVNPTEALYGLLDSAYKHFNKALFDNKLPYCLITVQRHKGAYGYFSSERFQNSEGAKTDEIALNPAHFTRSVEETLSTLAHEMAHLWQAHYGKPGAGAYHNREWAKKMEEIGLMASDTGAPGGKKTGNKVSHYVMEGGTIG